jgi:long-chain acyl-CoA synthetase
MSNIAHFAQQTPDQPAVIYGNGEHVETYAELDRNSRRIALALRRAGLAPGGSVAVLLGNANEFFDVYWACLRSGVYFTPINWHLAENEIQYIVENCDAEVFIANAAFAPVAARVASRTPRVHTRLCVGGAIEGFTPLADALASVPADPDLPDQTQGSVMLYSSGTTGMPKGVRRALTGMPFNVPGASPFALFMGMFGIKAGDRYLVPAPLYHAAPLTFAAAQHALGSTCVVMRRFDPEDALRMIQDQRVTASQWVPTHFKRLLQLPEATRKQYDVSSLRVAIHAAAPCPVPIKEAMLDWWGDAIVEYYAGTEGGGTLIRAEEWRKHPGSVGRHWAGGRIHILDEHGEALCEPGREGAVYFEAPEQEVARFRYYKDDAKTQTSYRGNLFTLGDIGYLDGDGYLFLTDRQSNMIISGGVNIYPQETENILIAHPKVHDVAVLGVPNEEMGEEVKAVVVPAAGCAPGDALEAELIAHCRALMAHYKCPRTIDFVDELPRTETGKMAKRRLKERYWSDGRRI